MNHRCRPNTYTYICETKNTLCGEMQEQHYSAHLCIKEKLGVCCYIKREIMKRTNCYRNGTKCCRLCLEGRLFIIMKRESNKLLNAWSVILSKCRHSRKCLLVSRVKKLYIVINHPISCSSIYIRTFSELRRGEGGNFGQMAYFLFIYWDPAPCTILLIPSLKA